MNQVITKTNRIEMAICKLCQRDDRKADKKNTHCLTDGIIRSALNIDGSNIRGKGFYFEINSATPFVEFGIQQDTPTHKVEEEIGRELTDAERETGMRNPSAVDDCFCSVCEKHFAGIESKFMSTILPKFRKADLTGITSRELPDANLVRLFFYLQFWRSAVGLGSFSMPETTLEKLRQIILNYPNVSDAEIRQFPLNVTYLGATNEAHEFTKNLVGPANGDNPYILFMNDFVLQLYDDQSSIKRINYHGLNDLDYQKYINFNEEKFVVKVFSHEQRLALLESILEEESKRAIALMRRQFREMWFAATGVIPSYLLTSACLYTIIFDEDAGPLQYTQETVQRKMNEFIAKYLPVWQRYRTEMSIFRPERKSKSTPKKKRKRKPMRKSERSR